MYGQNINGVRLSIHCLFHALLIPLFLKVKTSLKRILNTAFLGGDGVGELGPIAPTPIIWIGPVCITQHYGLVAMTLFYVFFVVFF